MRRLLALVGCLAALPVAAQTPPPDSLRVDVPPRPLVMAPLHLPDSVVATLPEGRALLRVWVTEIGKVQRVRVLRGLAAPFDSAAVVSVRTWTFAPAQQDGFFVAAWTTVPVRFRVRTADEVAAHDTLVALPRTVPPDGCTFPTVARTFQPAWPSALRRAGQGGRVVVRALVSILGRVERVDVQASPHPDLTRAVVEAVRRWQFTPGACGGHPVPSWTTVPFTFRS